jgi:hypothetical protein
MNGRARREFDRCIDDYFHLCEKLLFRTLLLACLIFEVGKFIWVMVR